MKIKNGSFPWIAKEYVFGAQVPPVLKPPFAVLVKEGKTEVKPIVLCRECRFFDCAGCVLGHHCKADGNWFCADGEGMMGNGKELDG